MAAVRTVLFRVGLAFLVVGAVASAALVWRLSRGPIALPFLDRWIEAALSGLASDLIATIEHVELVWAYRRPEIRVAGVRLNRADGTPVVSLPELAVWPSLRALVHGRIAVGRIGVSGMRVAFARSADGRLMLGKDSAPAVVEVESPDLLAALLTPQGSMSGDLSRIELHSAHLELDDRVSATRWIADDADARVSFGSQGLALRLQGEIRLQGGTLAGFRELTLLMAAEARVSISADGSITRLAFEAHGENGRIAPARDSSPPIALHSLEATGSYSGESKIMEVQSLRGNLGSSRLESSGTVSMGGGRPAIDVRGELRSLPVGELERLWPVGFAVETRAWISRNIEDGRVRSCRFGLRLAGGGDARPPLPDDAVDVRFDFDDLTVHYLRPLDPLRSVHGSARLTAGRFEALVEGAEAGNLRVRQGQMSVDLRSEPPAATITAAVQGPTGELVSLLDRPPLGIPSRLGIPSSGVGGTSDAHADLRFPLVPGLSSADVRVTAEADLTEASLPRLFGDIGTEHGQLRVRVDGGRFEVEGETGVTGAPVVSAPLRVTLSAEPADGGAGRLQGKLEGRDLRVEGEARLDGSTLDALSLRRLQLGKSDVSTDILRDANGRYQVSLRGASVDLEPLRRRLQPNAEAASRLRVPWDLDFDVGRAFTGGDLELSEVRGRAAGDGESVRTLRATAKLRGGGGAQIALEARDGTRRLDVEFDQGGKVLQQLGVFENADGGHLTLAATIDDREPNPHTEGQLDLRNFRVVRAPILARILGLGSLNGIAGLLEGEGIAFTRARLPFTWSEGKLALHDATAVGAIGLTAAGALDTRDGHLELAGNIIPAYTLNSALGKVPYLGELLIGGQGEGVFGIRYQVRGTREKPEIDVNPLSALAPGTLRRMFFEPFRRDKPRDEPR